MRGRLGVQFSFYSALMCGSAHVQAQEAHPVSAPAATASPAVAPAAAPAARAVPRVAPKPTDLTAEQLRVAQEKLEGDATAIEQALGLLAQLGGDAAAQSIVARLRRGLPPQLTETAIAALLRLQRPAAAPALLELTLHRRVAIRVKAIAALGELKLRSAQSALLYALDDPSAEVRSAAVDALGKAGNPRALPALLAAADRGLAGAWQAIGALASAADLKRILEHAQAGDITPLRPALDVLMTRANLPLEAKTRLVQELEKLGSPSARACLVGWLAELKTDGPARVRQALFASIKKLDQQESAQQKPQTPAETAKPKLGKLLQPHTREALAEAPSASLGAAQ